MSFMSTLQALETFDRKIYVVCAILIIFTLGTISILITPEEEQFYEENVPSTPTKKVLTVATKKEEEEEEVMSEENSTPVETTPIKSTPTKSTANRRKTPAAKKKDVIMSPTTRSGRVTKAPVFFEPGSPNGM